MDNSYNIITIPEIKTPDLSQGLNNAPIEDTQLKVGNNRDISGMQYFAMDIWASSGATGDTTPRILNLIGFNGDTEKTYTQEIITALGTTTAKITKTYTIDTPVSNIIKVPSGKICRVTSHFNSTTQLLEVSITGSKRYLKSGNNILTSINTDLVFINSGKTTNNVTLKFYTSAAEKPIFGFLIEIF